MREVLAEAGDDPGELELSPIEGGASRQTFLVRAGGEPAYVLRREPRGGMSFTSLEVELGAIKAADLAGVAVAPTVAFEPAGGRFGEGAGAERARPRPPARRRELRADPRLALAVDGFTFFPSARARGRR